MKITITIPDKELKKAAATVAMATGNNLPENFSQIVDETPEVDITELLNSDPETKVAIQGMTYVAMQVLIEKCEQSES